MTKTHLASGTPTYQSWSSMKRRCTDPRRPNYKFYGGRGIRVCKRWMRFENFLADMGERPPGMTLDRYPDKNGDYKPSNCRWASIKEQANNRRPKTLKEHCIRGHKLPSHRGVRKCLQCHAMHERKRRRRIAEAA